MPIVTAGLKERTRSSREKIQAFVQFYKINMDEFDPAGIDAYDTFEDFFVRKHKPGTRPIFSESDLNKAVTVADSRVVVYDSVAVTRAIWIKGRHFTIENLIKDCSMSKKWADGAVASFRLCPQDYHRFHSPVTGIVTWWKRIPGEYYNVDPVALQSHVDILSENARHCACISSKEFGEVLFVAVGATGVGTIKFHQKLRTEGSQVKKGEEIGHFEFGGSSILVVFEKGRIQFDEDLIKMSQRSVCVNVELGMSMGTANGT
ncbi:hypothetical protein RBB50_012724 [Rhinocladiella similis]